jgi:hypothetical protein
LLLNCCRIHHMIPMAFVLSGILALRNRHPSTSSTVNPPFSPAVLLDSTPTWSWVAPIPEKLSCGIIAVPRGHPSNVVPYPQWLTR